MLVNRVRSRILYTISINIQLSCSVFITLLQDLVKVSLENCLIKSYIKMGSEHQPHQSDSSILSVVSTLPVHITNRVFVESCYVFNRSPFLRVISWLLELHDKLGNIIIVLSEQCSVDHFCSLVDVGKSVEETFDTCESLSEGRFRIVSVVEVFSHNNYN